ncbi:MAG: type 1 glutamine amidotransferase domain-containing protein [Rhodanobacteraceae bacterium]|nr:type 1 glutamine amidotransferase domain-containing protein [Rhodanobacteraceae bacterium]
MYLPNPIRRAAACLLFCLSTASAGAADKVLIVVSAEGRDQGKTRPGFEMDEFAQAWAIFRDNGLTVDVASPRGGKAEADKYDAKAAYNARVVSDADAMAKLAATRATADIDPSGYAAVYVVGGKGAMFDLPADAALQRLLGSVYQQGGVVAAVCHGPAALVDVRLPDGRHLVKGKALTGFSNEEEAVFGKRWAASFPFALEDAMRERGALWQEAPLMMPKLVVDGRLITGQNPYSTALVAEAIVAAMGRTPVAREPWRDERSLQLVQRLLGGDSAGAQSELAARRDDYDINLIGVLGYYQLKAATQPPAVRDALAVMQLAAPHMTQPQLKLGMAEAHHRLGEAARARELVAAVLAETPDLEEALRLKKRLDG